MDPQYDQLLQQLQRYCTYQDRCHLEVRQKMKQLKVPFWWVDELMAALITDNFLNEERFAHSYVRGKFNQKGWGKVRIRMEMQKRQIRQNLIDQALETEIDPDMYEEVGKAYIEKKNRELIEEHEMVRRQKIMRFMAGKGYEGSLVIEWLSGNT